MLTRNFIFFDNSTRDRLSVLRKLVHNHDNPLLDDFTHQTAFLLREEVSRQPRHIQSQIPPFADIVELIERSHDRNYPILEYALLAIYQIGSLLLYSEKDNAWFTTNSAGEDVSNVLGVETGLIAAAAVAVSSDALELSKIGPHAAVLALRLGIHIHNISQLMSSTDADGKLPSGYGSMVLEGMTESEVEAVLAQADVTKAPLGSRPYIKEVYTDAGIVVTGPFEVLLELTKLPALEEHVGIISPTAGCLNAPHLYGTEDVEQILGGWSGEESFRGRHLQRTTSSSNRITAASTDGYDLLKEHLREILEAKLVFPTLCAKVAASGVEGLERKLFAFGRSPALDELLATLQLQGVSDILPSTVQGGPTDTTGGRKGERIAIVGYSGRFPGAADAELLWELLRDGSDVHREVPPDRFDIDTHYDATGARKNTTQTRYGAFVDNPGLFDPRFFNVSPREAFQMDPVQRLTLITAYEALEMAGTVAGRTPSTQNSRIGTFYGQAGDDWREVNSGQDIDTYFIPSGIRAFTPGRVNYHFKFSGPSYNVDTACSSSFAAIQLACTSLAKGECDTAITGGVNILTNPDIFAGLSRGYFLSPTGQCKTFDDSADGYCRADGVSSVVLKRLEDAEADNDNILAVILGSKTNHSAEAASITRPHHGAQAFLCRSIMEQAGVDPHAVEYVEMHGTGTQAGDYNEMLSVSEVFASEHTSTRSSPLYVGAVKANIGHGEAASGAMSLIKVLKMLEHNSIPPNVGIKSGILNTKFPKNLTERNLHIPMELTHWAPHGDRSPRVAFLNNFSAAGGNTALLLQEGPRRTPPSKPDPRSRVVVSISARSQSALKNNMKNLAAYLASNPSISVADLSYTTTARRLTYNYRFAFSAPDTPAVQRALAAAVGQDIRPIQPQPPKVAFMFTGQGAMYCSLARSLFETSSQFRSTILICEKLAKAQGFASFLAVIDGSVSDLSPLRPLVVQLATACVQIALVELWASLGIKPATVVGHSIGEYAALYAAGVLSASEVIHLVGSRAELMEKLCTAGSHGMLAVKCSRSALAQYMDAADKDLDIACENSPEETVVAGLQRSIDDLAETLSARGLKNKKLAVTHAFHSSQMDPILSHLERVAGSVRLSQPKIPIISSLLGRVLEADDLSPQYLVRHTRDSVRFSAAVADASDKEIIDDRTVWVEVGSHPICSGMLKTILGSETVGLASLQKSEDPWTTLSSSLAALYNRGLPINWMEYHRDFERSLRLLTLPPYAFDLKNYWIQYQNDWCLSKGDAAVSATKEILPPPAPKKQFTLTVQEILEEKVEDEAITFLAQSDISHPKLRELVLGHLVNGAGLCPSVVYAEMALTIGEYLYKKSTDGAAPAGMNVCSMEVGKPLILKTNADEAQLIRVAATLRDGIVNFKFFGVDDNGNTTAEYAVCQVKYGDPEKWLRKWNKNAYMVQEQIKRLEGAVGTNASTHRVGRGMAYKLFAALVNYADSFRGMDEVVLDAVAFEATAKVNFKSGETSGDFFMDPRWIDNLCHISGFIVNGSEATASDEQVYISHGWESLRFGSTISRDKTYRCYARMSLTDNVNSAVRQGDVYILDGDTVVGVAGGVKFQCVPRKILNHLLPPVSTASKAGTSQKKAKTATPPSKTSVQPASLPQTVSRPSAAPAQTVTADKPSSMRVLGIIADECSIDLAELDDSSAFEDFGLDSLLSLTILAKLREELSMDLPSSFFVDNPTVGDLKSLFFSPPAEESPETGSVLTPSRDSSPSKDSVVERGTTTINKDDSIAITIRTLLSEELGVGLDEITDDADLADMGMDSLMSLSVTAGIREQTELTVPDDILIQCTTVAQLEQALGVGQPSTQTTTTPAVPQPVPTPTNIPQGPQPKALSFLIQGNPRTARETVFFFPDGSGSATSYAPIPAIGDDVCAYALNCPFMKIPEQFNCGIDGVSRIYLDEVKRRQPKGPYNFGGWSAGGVMAYEAALQLQAQGETVSRLILIDCPCPVKLEPVPSKLFRFFDSMGVLGDRSNKQSPPYLIPHFEAMIRNLDTYVAKAFPRGTEPKVLAIWARDGVCKDPNSPRPVREPSDPKVMDWLLDNRTDLGPNGWDQLIGKENFTCVSMDGNHFSMIVDPLVKELGRLLRQHY